MNKKAFEDFLIGWGRAYYPQKPAYTYLAGKYLLEINENRYLQISIVSGKLVNGKNSGKIILFILISNFSFNLFPKYE